MAANSTRIGAVVLSLLFGAPFANPACAQSITDRFKSLFGGGSSSSSSEMTPAQTADDELSCPAVAIRSGASTYAVGLPGKTAVGADLRFQATITRTARECTKSGGQVVARVGIQGRVIAGPAGAPANVDIPLRVAVVQEGVSPKPITTKAYRTSVAMTSDTTASFSFVAEDLVYPVPSGADGDTYVFYIGFDPQSLAPEPKAKRKK